MSKKEKLMAKIKNNPKVIRFEETNKILLDIGFDVTIPKGGSSHYTYNYKEYSITIPKKKPHIKQIYIKKVIEILSKLEGDD